MFLKREIQFWKKGKLPSPHLWFRSPGRKWLPGVWWGDLPHRGSRKYGRPQAGMCPGHSAGRVQNHLQNIPQVGTDLGKPMTVSEQGPRGGPLPISLEMSSEFGQIRGAVLT